MRSFAVVLFLVALPVASFGSQTDSFQCSHGIVSIGDTREEVAAKCGRPTGRTYTDVTPIAGSEAFRDRNSYSYESHWTYDPGPNGFVYKVEFKGGKVRYIENTERYGTQ